MTEYTGSGLSPLWDGGSLLTVWDGGRNTDRGYRSRHGEGAGYRLEYAREGVACVSRERDGTVTTLSAGQILLLNRDEPAVIWADRQQPYRNLWLTLSGTLVQTLWDLYRIPDVHITEAPVLSALLSLWDLLSAPDPSPEHSGQIAAGVGTVLTQAMAPKLFPVPAEDTVPRRIQRYIDGHLYEDLSLDSLASRFGYAKMYLIRLFRDEIGTTPMQYVLRRRMESACSLLTGTVMSVGEIAALLHYSSAQHFAAAFRRFMGVTPSVYRRSPEGRKWQ